MPKISAKTALNGEPESVPVGRETTSREIFAIGLLGGIVLLAALPPWNLADLVWIAAIPWILCVFISRPFNRRDFVALWCAGAIHWIVFLQGLRLAHPALYLGWLTLGCYLGVYLPLFVFSARGIMASRRLPAIIALPMLWVGWEYARAYFATGLTAGSLPHALTSRLLFCQIADFGGHYAIAWLVMTVATAFALWLIPTISRRERMLSTGWAALLFTATLGYGSYRLHEPTADVPLARLLIVQGNIDTVLDDDPERPRVLFHHYRDLTLDALERFEPCDAVLWPESAYIFPLTKADPQVAPPASFGVSREEFHERMLADAGSFRAAAADWLARLNEGSTKKNTSFLAGGMTHEFTEHRVKSYNSAFYFSAEGKLAANYHKRHLVLCGEYIPLIGEFTPIGSGLASGTRAESFMLGPARACPAICFESTVPQLMLRQVNELAQRDEEPDLLVNLTNDGWFYGSAVLEIHWQCTVLRAIENRKPFVIVANTGISGSIDGCGRVLHRSPTHATETFVAQPKSDGRRSLYRTLGDWPAAVCCVVAVYGLVLAWRKNVKIAESS